MNRKFSTFLLLITLSLPLAADTGLVSSKEGSVRKINSLDANEISHTVHSEVVLKMQEKHNDQILNTVYWFIGTTTALFAVMLGFGWFSNNRDNKRNQEELRRLVEDEIRAKKEELDLHFSGQFEEIKDTLKKFEKRIEASITGATNRVWKDAESKILKIEYELEKIQYEKWMQKKVYRNACRSARSMLEYSIQAKNNYQQSDSLDLIRDLLKNEAFNLKLDADDARGMMIALESLDDTHRVVKETIIKAIMDSR